MITFVAGDVFTRLVQLTKLDLPFSISPVAVIRARIVHLRTGATGSVVFAQPDGTGGSIWTTSSVYIRFEPAETQTWTVGRSKLEIEVADPDPLTWFVCNILVLPETILLAS